MSIEYLDSNRRLRFDYLLGLRAWGLVLYGALPSSLVALGVLKGPKLNAEFGEVFGPYILLAVVPLVVLYLLVRQRLGAWYLLDSKLWIRTTVVAFVILALCSAISWAGVSVEAGKGGLEGSAWWIQLFEAVLLGLVVLVASSTLLMGLIKESGGLPGLPPADFVSDVSKLRDSLSSIGTSEVWRGAVPSHELQGSLRNAQDIAGRVARQALAKSPRREFFAMLADDLASTERAHSQVQRLETKWPDYFSEDSKTPLDGSEQSLRAGVQRLRQVVIDG